MMYETLSLNCHHDSILKRLSRSTLHCLVTEESEAGEEHALAPVLVAAPGALVVELETKAMRSYTKRESPSRGLSVITNLRMDLRFKLYLVVLREVPAQRRHLPRRVPRPQHAHVAAINHHGS